MDTQQPGSKKTLYIVIAIVVLAILIGFGMNSFGPKAIAPGVDLERNLDGSATYTSEEGSVTIGANSLPENWPSDAPKYGNGAIQYSASTNEQTGDEGSAIVFMTSDNASVVVEFYKKELASNGWTVEQTATIGAMTIISATKDERTFGVQITDAGNGQTTVTVGISL